jgi:phosphoribosylformylglycinamidine synthase
MLRVKDHGRVVAEIPNKALADEAPLYDRPYTKPYREAPMDGPKVGSTDPNADLVALLTSGDLCSKRWIWEQYDYMVRTNTTAGPGADAAIARIKDTGTAVAMALDGNERYCYLDPREGAKLVVAECCRNVSTAGALPVAATNNLNFGNPERPEIMAQLVETIEGMAEACCIFETPITGGNVSLYNETLGEAIRPSPVMGIVGLMRNKPTVPIAFPEAGLAVVLLGGLGDSDHTRFGGTQYAKVVLKALWGLPPALDMDLEKRVQAAIRQLVTNGLVSSAHDLSGGGLAVALAECSFGKEGVGADIRLQSDLPDELLLFHEGPSRILVSTPDLAAVLEVAESHGVEALVIGETAGDWLSIKNRGESLVRLNVRDLAQRWEEALPSKLLHTGVGDVRQVP